MEPNRRKLKRELEELKANVPRDLTIETEIVEMTEDMVDDSGNLIDEKLPEGYRAGDTEYVLETDSPVVTVTRETEPDP